MELPQDAIEALDACFATYKDTNRTDYRDVLLVWAGERPATLVSVMAYETTPSAIRDYTAPFRRLCGALDLAYAQTVMTVSDDRGYNNVPEDAEMEEELQYAEVSWDVAPSIDRIKDHQIPGNMSDGEFLGYPHRAAAAFDGRESVAVGR